jgi:ureidoglycolate lyase
VTARLLVPAALTASAFEPFGDVVEPAGEFSVINGGTTHQFANLARVEVSEAGGTPRVSIYGVVPYELPLPIRMLERHPLGSQLFMPLTGQRFLVVVAPRGDRIDPATVKAFVTNGRQGVNYRPGTWHHPVIALDDLSTFLVIDRAGPGANCDEFTLEPGALLLAAP